MSRVKSYVDGEKVLRPKRARYYSQGPKPRTERGKRRHAARTPQQAEHAKSVWAGTGGTYA